MALLPTGTTTLLARSVQQHGTDHNALHTKHNNTYDVIADYGAAGDGTTDDSTAIQNAIDAAEAAGGGNVYLPSSTCYLASGLTIDSDQVTLCGDGRTSRLKLAAGITGIQVSGTARTKIHSFVIEDGATALDVDGATDSYFTDLHLLDQTGNAIEVDGDDSTEQHYRDITIRECDGIGFNFTRTNGTDTGGMYLTRVRVLSSTGNGFKFASTHTSESPIYVFMDTCVSDSIPTDSVVFDNVAHFQFNNCFFGCSASAGDGTAVLSLNDTFAVQVGTTKLTHGGSTGTPYCIYFDGSAKETVINGVVFDGASATAMGVDASWTGAGIVLGRYYDYTASTTDSWDDLVTGAGAVGFAPFTLWTRSGGGGNDTLVLRDADNTGGSSLYLRMSNGELQIIDGSFNTAIMTLDQSGNLYIDGTLTEGTQHTHA